LGKATGPANLPKERGEIVNRELPASIENFSLFRGGPFFGLMRVLRLADPMIGLGSRSAVALCMVTWLPLLALSLIQGLAVGSSVKIPFLLDFTTSIRFLFALPLMIMAERLVDIRVAEVPKHLVRSGLVADSALPTLQSIVKTAQRLCGSVLAELAGVAVVAFGVVYLRIEMAGSLTSWQFLPDSPQASRTLAGWWYILVSISIFQFLFYRWIWRYLVWIWMLWRISRLDLQLIPTHPDRAAGLSVIGLAQSGFAILAAGLSAVISATYAQEFLHGTTTIGEAEVIVVGYVTLILVIFLAPPCFFTGVLLRVQVKGLRDYGALADRYTHGFHRKWIKGEAPAEEHLMGSADIQSLADLANSYGVIRTILYAPLDPRVDLLPIVACIVLPLLPAVLTAIPVDQIAHEIVARLL
jgi:hypothetical protein